MSRGPCLSLLLCVALSAWTAAGIAADSKEIKKQRSEAQKERQLQRNERTKEINEATRALREYARDLKTASREETQLLDTDYQLRRVDLRAEHDRRVATAEAEYQKKLMGLFMQPGTEYDEATVKRLQEESKAYADEMFALRRQSAGELHQARMENEEEKNRVLTAADQDVLAEADSLGLMDTYEPILATPIGDGLTKNEERWNERERKEVARIEERNRKTLAEYRNGEALRSWQMENLNEDFELEWQEKAKLHELDSEQLFYNTLFLQSAQSGKPVDQQKFMDEMAEHNKQRQNIRIDANATRKKLGINRRKERQEILKR